MPLLRVRQMLAPSRTPEGALAALRQSFEAFVARFFSEAPSPTPWSSSANTPPGWPPWPFASPRIWNGKGGSGPPPRDLNAAKVIEQYVRDSLVLC